MKYLTQTALIIILSYLPILTHAADYEPLVGIPNVSPQTDFDGYINSLYVLSISIAALLAVIKIIIAGVKWMMTDVVTSKGEAKKDIQGALIGLLIVLSAVLILTVINPKLVSVNLTLTKPGSLALSPNSVPEQTLDMTDIQVTTLTPTAKVQYKPSTASPEQKSLFSEKCKDNLDRKTNPQVKELISSTGPRCLIYSPTENAYAMGTNCSVTNCKSICNSDTGTGVGIYQPDPLDKTIGYCVKPKYP